MKKRFHRGLVVGKFSPLHRGHELVINRAFGECNEVILISYSKPELPGCDVESRERWLASLFPSAERLVVTDARLKTWKKANEDPDEIPPNDAEEIIHRRFCGYLCRKVLGKEVDAVFTSENYGEGFARELTLYFQHGNPEAAEVSHVMVDFQRGLIPVSGTLLRENIHKNRQWLSPIVYSSFVKRICLLGGESSGKSTLAERLAGHFQTEHVPEYGRELWNEQGGNLNYRDMSRIAETQIQREEKMTQTANEFLFCDTSPLTTLFYSNYLFGKTHPRLEQLARRHYEFTVLCAPDFPFVQDGTRQMESFRKLQHEWYLRELSSQQMPYLLVMGSIQNRIKQVGKFIKA